MIQGAWKALRVGKRCFKNLSDLRETSFAIMWFTKSDIFTAKYTTIQKKSKEFMQPYLEEFEKISDIIMPIREYVEKLLTDQKAKGENLTRTNINESSLPDADMMDKIRLDDSKTTKFLSKFIQPIQTKCKDALAKYWTDLTKLQDFFGWNDRI